LRRPSCHFHFSLATKRRTIHTRAQFHEAGLVLHVGCVRSRPNNPAINLGECYMSQVWLVTGRSRGLGRAIAECPAENFPDEQSVKSIRKGSDKMNHSMKAIEVVRGISQSLCMVFIVVVLWRALSAKPRASRSEYCSGSRCLGRWFRLERRLRHSCEGMATT
jgi:hypothetical protein